MNDAAQFEAYRPLMLSIAYRMLGSITDAEDIVQKAYIRYQTVVPDEIVSHQAFLSTVVTRLCLNHLELAQTQRETYVGEWLPEPVITPPDEKLVPAHQAELHESLSLAFLSLLEQLTPLERAVFLLREVFDYEYSEIAQIVDKGEDACRQLLSRAKKHIAERRPRFKVTPEAHRQMLNRFIQTIENGKLDELLELLADDVVMWADGGGKTRRALLRPLHGKDAVSRFIMVSPSFMADQAYTEIIEVNGEPAFVVRVGNITHVVLTITIDGDHISAVRVIGNPDKLQHLNRGTAQ